MNKEQAAIFSKILDKNWEMKTEQNVVKKYHLLKELDDLKTELKTSMGAEAYNEWMDNGRKMFAPKTA